MPAFVESCSLNARGQGTRTDGPSLALAHRCNNGHLRRGPPAPNVLSGFALHEEDMPPKLEYTPTRSHGRNACVP